MAVLKVVNEDGWRAVILIAVPIETKISRGTEIRNRRYVRICFVLQETSFSIVQKTSHDLIKGARIKLKKKSDAK